MIYMTSILPQTFARHPQIWSRHPQTPSRHPPDIGVLRIRGHWKKGQYLSWHDFYTFLPTDLVLMHPQTPLDPIQTLPDTIQTPQDIFMQYRALEEKVISEYHGLIYFFCQQIWYWCLPRHPQTPSRHYPEALRHHPDTPRQRRFCNRGYWKKGQYPSMA